MASSLAGRCGADAASNLPRRSILGLDGAKTSRAAPLATAEGAGPIRLPGALRSHVASMTAARHAPAIAIAAVKDGVCVVIDALGYAGLPFEAGATGRTLFHLGSASKHFTAALIMQLARAGAIGLDDPLGSHARDIPASLASMPVRALLSHTSGAPEYEALPGYEGDRPIPRGAFLTRMAALPAEFEPGDAWSYSNTGYVLLGYLISDVTGSTYRQALTDSLVRPAGFLEARVDDAPAVIAGRAEPYVLADKAVRHALMMEADFSGWPDGGMLMSARDAVRWELALQRGSVIPPESLTRMTTSVVLSTGRACAYGFGWRIDQVAGRAIHYHSGSVPGFMSFYLRVPSERLGVVVMTNLGSAGARSLVAQVAQEVAEWAAPGSTPLSLSPIADSEPGLTAEARGMVLRGDQALPPARFASEIAVLLARDAAAKATPPNRTSSGLGAFDLVEAFAEGPCTVRRYRCVYPDGLEHLAFAYTAQGQIYRVRSI